MLRVFLRRVIGPLYGYLAVRLAFFGLAPLAPVLRLSIGAGGPGLRPRRTYSSFRASRLLYYFLKALIVLTCFLIFFDLSDLIDLMLVTNLFVSPGLRLHIVF